MCTSGKRILSLLLFFALTAPIVAQPQRYRTNPLSGADVFPHQVAASPVLPDIDLDRFSTEDGLPDDRILAIAQDSVGFLWFGTLNGLARYDGTSFMVYTNDPADSTSLSHDSVDDLFVDSRGTLWVATNGGGLNSYDPDTDSFTRYQHDAANTNSLSGDEVTCIREDREGILWVGTHSGLNRFDPESGVFTRFRHDPDDSGQVERKGLHDDTSS